jgi:hypothetical protein
MMQSAAKIIYYQEYKNKYGALVEWHWKNKTKIHGEKPVPVPLCPRGGHYYCFFNRGGGGARCKFCLGQIPILYFTIGHDHCPIRRLRHNTVLQDSNVKQANATYIKYKEKPVPQILGGYYIKYDEPV